jgi:hypothetical protein
MKPTNFSALPPSRDEVRKLGIDRFFTGRPCKHGHVAPRYVSTTQCSQCQLEHARKAGGWKPRPSKEEFLRRLKAIVEQRGGSLISKKYSPEPKSKSAARKGTHSKPPRQPSER